MTDLTKISQSNRDWAWNKALDAARDIALAIDSGRGNEKEIAKAIEALKK